MGTPHNSAAPGEIAKTVLMPGDPLRAEFIAKNWLTDVKLVNQVRNIYAFTGKYQGKEVTVMASGMGMPSIGIYSYELFTQYGVERIIRIGSAGAYTERLKLYDVVLAEECWSESSFGKTQNGDAADVKYPDSDLNKVIMEAGKECGIEVKPAKIHSSDVFYSEPGMDGFREIYEKHGDGELCTVPQCQSTGKEGCLPAYHFRFHGDRGKDKRKGASGGIWQYDGSCA